MGNTSSAGRYQPVASDPNSNFVIGERVCALSSNVNNDREWVFGAVVSVQADFKYLVQFRRSNDWEKKVFCESDLRHYHVQQVVYRKNASECFFKGQHVHFGAANLHGTVTKKITKKLNDAYYTEYTVCLKGTEVMNPRHELTLHEGDDYPTKVTNYYSNLFINGYRLSQNPIKTIQDTDNKRHGHCTNRTPCPTLQNLTPVGSCKQGGVARLLEKLDDGVLDQTRRRLQDANTSLNTSPVTGISIVIGIALAGYLAHRVYKRFTAKRRSPEIEEDSAV